MLLQTQVESFTVCMANSSLCKLTQVLTDRKVRVRSDDRKW